uniref:Uncharacterized protein n=1 Tax=Oncorhynchus tshawytscha TaxID=74940 RepID=A0AAZ3QT87_ONCTS
MEVSLSSLGGQEGGSDEPTDTEGQELFSDSMSDHTEPPTGETLEPTEPTGEPRESTGDQIEQTQNTELREPSVEPTEQTEPEARGGLGFFFKEEVHCEDEMAQRRAALLGRQQKRAEDLKRRRQWNEQERESRPPSEEEERRGSLPQTPPPSCTPPPPPVSPPSPPTTPSRRGDFTRKEYAHRQQIRIMSDLDKVLRQKHTNQGRVAAKKSRPDLGA